MLIAFGFADDGISRSAITFNLLLILPYLYNTTYRDAKNYIKLCGDISIILR